MKDNCSKYLGVVTSAGASDEHPMSTRSASDGRRWHSRGMQLICTLVLLFTFAIGNVWGTDWLLSNENTNSDKNAFTVDDLTFSLDKAHGGAAWKIGDYTHVKISANKTYTMTIPETVTVSNVRVIGYTNDNSTASHFSTIGGNDVSSTNFPKKASNASAQTTQTLDVPISQKGGTIAFSTPTSGGKQLAVIIIITGTKASSDPVDPVFTYTPATYTIGDPALDLSTKVTSTNTTGAITFAVSTADAGTTGASIASDKNFTATAVGTAKITVSQAASTGYNAKTQDIDVTVVAPAPAVCPSGLTISGTAAYTEGQTISLNAALSEGNGEITYTWYKGADLATAKAAGSIGTGTSFSKASCTTGDAGNYFCVATKDACSDAESTAYAVTVEEKTCPTSGELYSMTMKSKSLSGVTQNTEVALAGDYATEEGGVSYIGNKNSDAGKAQIKTDGGGTVYFNGNDAYVKIVLDCPLKADDKITFVPGSGTRQVCFTTTNTRTDTYQTSSNTFTVSSAFLATAADPENVTTLYVWRIGSSTYLHSLTITRPYNITFESAYGVAPSATTGFEVTLAEITGVASWEHTGWTANKDVKVGDDTKTAGTALAVDATVKVSADTKFTATWVPFSVKHTVTYYDGEAIPANKLGEEEITEGGNPTGAGLAPRKLGYTFGGWSTTEGGAAVTLSDINVTADMPLYAVWNAVNCATKSGTIYTMSIVVAPLANCTITSTTGTHDLYQYEGISGGEALLGNNGTSNNCILTTDKTIILKDDNSYIKLDFDCPLKEGDKIVYSVSGNNPVLSTGNSKPSTPLATLDRSKTEFVIPAESGLIDAQTVYVWKGGGNTTVTYINIVRPAKYAVTFNMHGHGDQVAQQDILEGGKVSEPATTDITGWDFGGWFKTYVAEPESYSDAWDFENDVVSAVTELHAKWTAHVASNDVALGTLSVNGEAITIVPSQTVYAVELPMGTTATPTVTATANDENVKEFTITQATAVDGSATIYVKAEDNTTEATYTINFSVATSKDIELVWDKSKERCDATKPDANVLIAAMSEYLSASYTGSAAEGGSLTTGKTTGSKIIITAKPGYAFKAMGFYGKIEDGTCNFYNDGVVETIGTSTGDACYANVFSNDEVHEFVIELTGSNGVYIRNMQLTIIEACTPITLAWDEEPVEFEVGKAGYAIAATANNGGTISYASADNTIIDVNASTGALTIAGLGSVALSASTPEGDGTTYCANGGDPIVLSKTVKTYYLVAFDGQNGEATDEVKYFSGDAAIAQPSDPSFLGHTFQGWFDAASAGNPVAFPLTPSASRTIYAQWVAQCDGATITTQPTGASYLTGRTPVALVCEATAGAGGALTYEWFTCDDEYKANPVAATAMPSTAVAGTFYYFCKVTEEGCAVEAFSDVVTITVADKTPICLIATTVTGATAHGAVTGLYGADRGGDADVNVSSSSYKMDKGKYIGVTLPDGYMFQEGDKVVINVKTVNQGVGFTLFDGKEGSHNLIIDTRDDNLVAAGANTVVLPAYAGSQSVYVMRENNDATGNLNSALDAIAVYRTCAPILNKVTVNGAEGKPNALKEVVFEVAASTTQSQLEAIAFDWVSNDDAWTASHAPVVANAWEFGVANTVTFTDKDGDQSVYTITVNKAIPSTNVELATLSIDGNAITVVPGQAVYNYEYPFGTAETPAPVVAATTADAHAELSVISQAASKNGTATFTVTAEDGTTYRDYTINISVSRIPAVVIYDGSTMTDIATKTGSDPSSGFSWSMGSNVASDGSNVAGTWQGKNYTHAVKGFKANANENNLVSFVVPEDYMAKVRLVGSTNSNGSERKMFIAKEATNDASKAIENYVITSSTYDAQGFVTDFMLPGTYYLGSTDSYRLFEFSVQLYPIDYSRDVTEGRYGTICLPNGGIMVGAALFEVAYYDSDVEKIFLDEVLNGEMVAGRPYIFLTNEGVNQIAVYYTDEENAPAGNYRGLFGSYSRINLAANANIYILKDNRYYFVDSDNVYCGENRAYFKMGVADGISGSYVALAPGRRRMSIGAGAPAVATGIENTGFESEAPRKVLINGELYILRGEKMYDAKGQLVK